MSLFARWLNRLRPPLAPRVFPTTFPRIDASTSVEEEHIPFYHDIRYYPVRIGEVFGERYQVVGKLGYGSTSTVWLAKDLQQRQHVTLKVFVRDQDLGEHAHNEINTYHKIEATARASSHPGRHAVRSVLDHLPPLISPAGDAHQCLVHTPLWNTARDLLYMNDTRRFTPLLVAMTLRPLLQALDILHTECRLVHTDIKADNLAYGIDPQDPVLEQFEQAEMDEPSPRKEVEQGHYIYSSRSIAMPDFLGYTVLCDLGSATPGDQFNNADAQPDAYRAPEMMLEIPWSYPVDIWNVGCMVWDLCQVGTAGIHLFEYTDPQTDKYRIKDHLASIISLLGPPPPELVKRCTVKSKFFNKDGQFDCGVPVPPPRTLESIETTWRDIDDPEDRAMFLRMIRRMVEWVPEKRATAAELVNDEWIEKHRCDK